MRKEESAKWTYTREMYQKVGLLFWGWEPLRQPSQKLQLGILEGRGPRWHQNKKRAAEKATGQKPPQLVKSCLRQKKFQQIPGNWQEEELPSPRQRDNHIPIGPRCLVRVSLSRTLSGKRSQSASWVLIPHCFTLSLPEIPKIHPFPLGLSCLQQSESIFPLSNYDPC